MQWEGSQGCVLPTQVQDRELGSPTQSWDTLNLSMPWVLQPHTSTVLRVHSHVQVLDAFTSRSTTDAVQYMVISSGSMVGMF